MRVAVPTEGGKKLRDRVSASFARAPTVTLIDLEGGETRGVNVEPNEASKLSQGAGPLFVKFLKTRDVEVVLTHELGPGASTIMESIGIGVVRVEAGVRVSEALKELLKPSQ